ncbi:hypothetical protein V8F20_003865 [Naviculisporaceae sp. PSN 640]
MAAASENQTPTLPRTNSITDPGQCWICYQDASETPGQRWVNACPCSLEAHEHCLLQWITREEHDGRSKDGAVKCPQCKAIITTQEPYDAVYAIRNRLHRAYSRSSPWILGMTIAMGGIAGSAFYGYQAFSVFAGPEQAYRWVFGRVYRSDSPMIMFKFWALAHVGPALVVGRLIPRVEYLVLPFSTLYATSLMHRVPMGQWPPSPEWIITLLPSIHLAYCNVYQKLLGPLERRLNRTLRGGNLDMDTGADGVAPAAAAPEPPARREPGFLANAMEMATAVVDMFQGNGEDGGLEVEVRIDAVADLDGGEEADNENAVIVERDQAAEAEAEAAAAPQAPAVPAPPAQAPAAQQDQPRNNNNRRERNNDLGVPSMWDVVNHMVTSLTLPAISWLMGELIRKAITGPSITSSVMRKRWGYSPAPMGLLQQRWGRSLVGGCLFIVLKDALVLYAKYRGAEAKKNRRIKEVPNRNRNTTTGTGTGTSTETTPATVL